jgi:NAD kinase
MPFNPDICEQYLTTLLEGKMRVFNRDRIVFQVQDAPTNASVVPPPFDENDITCYELLNEVVLKQSYGLHVGVGISEIECRVDGHLLARFQGDGLMIASPTGSTAYSMAAGGSIVHPNVSCLLLTPICPMTLSSRPVILPGDCTIQIKPMFNSVVLEGKYGGVIQPNQCVVVRLSKYPMPVFTRSTVTSDWVEDMGSRLNYARRVRISRDSEDYKLVTKTDQIHSDLVHADWNNDVKVDDRL